MLCRLVGYTDNSIREPKRYSWSGNFIGWLSSSASSPSAASMVDAMVLVSLFLPDGWLCPSLASASRNFSSSSLMSFRSFSVTSALSVAGSPNVGVAGSSRYVSPPRVPMARNPSKKSLFLSSLVSVLSLGPGKEFSWKRLSCLVIPVLYLGPAHAAG